MATRQAEPDRVYLDWNATTPPLDEVVAAVREAMQSTWANPSSIHADGRRARSLVEDARQSVAELVGFDPRDVVLTAGATEASNIALRSAFSGAGSSRTLVTSRAEHPSIVRVAEALEAEGRAKVRWLALLSDATIDLDDFQAALDDESVALCAVQWVNHETGAVQPIDAVMEATARRGIPLHVDVAQGLGKMAQPAWPRHTTLAASAHKFRGPQGVGALVGRRLSALEPLLRGGGQERGLRPGTVAVALAAGFGVAARHAQEGPRAYAELGPLRDAFEVGVLSVASGASVIRGASRVPHVTTIAFEGWQSAELVAALDLAGVSASGGSACSAGTLEPPAVIRATRGESTARASVRFSIGPTTGRASLDRAVRAIADVCARL